MFFLAIRRTVNFGGEIVGVVLVSVIFVVLVTCVDVPNLKPLDVVGLPEAEVPNLNPAWVVLKEEGVPNVKVAFDFVS